MSSSNPDCVRSTTSRTTPRPYLKAEIVIAVQDEGARTLDDVLVRRTRIALETRDPSPAVAYTAKTLARALDWGHRRREAEVRAFEQSPRARVPVA